MYTFSLESHTYIGGKPTHCHWCGNRLDKLRHIYKGAESLRYYDAEACLIKGEQRAVARRDAELKHLAGVAGRVA